MGRGEENIESLSPRLINGDWIRVCLWAACGLVATLPSSNLATILLEAGPDGVMACLQGFLLRHLLYDQPTIEHVKR